MVAGVQDTRGGGRSRRGRGEAGGVEAEREVRVEVLEQLLLMVLVDGPGQIFRVHLL